MENVRGECPYIPGLTADTERAILADADEAGIELLLKNGFRHFGRFLFRPVCRDCGKCVPVRIPVSSFSSAKNARRSRNRLLNKGFSFSLEDPLPDRQLYTMYLEHKGRFTYPLEDEREDYDLFVDSFFNTTPGAKVLKLSRGKEIAAIGHLDIVGETLSAVYCYWDPRYSSISPGKNMILQEIELSRDLGLSWLCLGYLVEENASMRYKKEYYPLEYSPHPGIWKPWLDQEGGIIPGAPLKPRFLL